MTPEGRVKAAIKKWLESEAVIPAARVHEALQTGDPFDGWYYMPVQNMYSIKGIPDFVGVWRSIGFGIEAKAKGGEPTDNQRDQLAAIEQAGGITCVCDDVSQLAAFKERMEQQWKNVHSKCRRPLSASSVPTQSGGSAIEPDRRTSLGSTAPTVWIAATRSAKVAYALAGAGVWSASP